MDNGPELWNTILAHIPGGIVAGGAVRDYLLARPAKDIDVFVPISWDPPNGFEGWLPHPEAEEYLAGDHVAFVFQQQIEGIVVDLIGVQFHSGIEIIPFSGHAVAASFDFGVTRSWYDGELHDTFEAMHDREKGRVTLMRDDRPERALRRFERFNERMGGSWTLWKDGQPYDLAKVVTAKAAEEEIVF